MDILSDHARRDLNLRRHNTGHLAVHDPMHAVANGVTVHRMNRRSQQV